KLLRFLVHGDTVCPVRGMQFAHRLHVSLRVSRKYSQRIHRIVIDRINVTALGIDINATVKFQLGQEASQNPLRFRKTSALGSIVGSIKYLDREQILILEKYFI